MLTNNRRFFSAIVMLLLALSMGTQGIAQSTRQDNQIILGEVSDDPVEAVEEAQPLVDYLAAQLADYGIESGTIVVAETIEDMIQLIEDGEVDIYFDSVYPATVISDATGAEFFIRRWKKGVEEYHSVIFASAESGITSIDDLLGHMISFKHEASTSGFILPYIYLFQEDLPMVEMASSDDTVAEDEIGYVFSGSEEDMLAWVFFGMVDAGAMENLDFEELDPDLREQLVVLAETEAMPRHVGLMHADIDDELATAITEVLLNMDETDAGQEALVAFERTAQFDDFPEGIDEASARMRELLDIMAGVSNQDEEIDTESGS